MRSSCRRASASGSSPSRGGWRPRGLPRGTARSEGGGAVDPRPREGERAMSAQKADEGQPGAKFIQICAPQNALFARDETGSIYQYNFTATTWEKLVAAR